MESFNDAISTNQLVLVDFYATWCGLCKMVHPLLEELKKQLGDRIRILKIDVDEYTVTAVQYQVRSVPTLILFRNGQRLWQQSGVLSLHELKNNIQKYL